MPTRSMATCTRLVSEQEVQALSIDAATGNVEAHYAYICDAFQAFMQRYAQQATAHAGERRVVTACPCSEGHDIIAVKSMLRAAAGRICGTMGHLLPPSS